MPPLDPDRLNAILGYADRQRGLIEHSQLLRCGLDRHAIRRLIASGWLRPVFRRVYLVGHAAPVEHWRETAAILAYGNGAMLVAQTSLAMSKVIEAPPEAPLHVAVVGRNCRAIEGVVFHRVTQLDPRDVEIFERLRRTKPARALLESACELGTHETERAVDEAIALGLVDRPALLAVIERYPGHRGAAILRDLADPNTASEITDSKAEAALAKLLSRAGAPPSQTQYPIGPYRADRCWPELKLIIEVDSVQFHRDRKRMEADNKRQDYLRRLGYTVIRFTRRQVIYEPEWVLLQIGQELALSSGASPASAG
jgi:very-short-patch-repair endonuclease